MRTLRFRNRRCPHRPWILPCWSTNAARLVALGAVMLLVSTAAVAQGPGRRIPPPPRPEPPHPAGVAPRAQAETPVGMPADYESGHFLLHTDIGAKHAKSLLAKLETMLGLISKYWGRPPHGTIELFVVDDLRHWPPGALNPIGVAKIAEQAGITLTQTLTLGGEKVDARAVVYAVARDGVAQHEAVHAYCGQTFGAAGPLWYAEGMAEMGNYWRPNDTSVNINPIVLSYLQHNAPQTLDEIIHTNSAQNFTSDSWQNYAWRWALCHLLANNANYAARFRPLGLGFLTEQRVSFEDTYGAMAKEIEFEYLFFVRHIEDGYRVDLCSWDWKKKFKPLADSSVSTRVEARRGWQPTSVMVKAGQRYEYSAAGAWQLERDGPELSADGDDRQAGQLTGVVFEDFELSEPIPLGVAGTFEAPCDGQLFARCADGWGKLADNKGAVTLKLRLAGKSDQATAKVANKPTP